MGNGRQAGVFGGIRGRFAPLGGEPILLRFAQKFKAPMAHAIWSQLSSVIAYSGGDLLDVRVHVNVNLSERTSLGREKEFNCPPPYFIRKDP
jgi:hypothetical protein